MTLVNQAPFDERSVSRDRGGRFAAHLTAPDITLSPVGADENYWVNLPEGESITFTSSQLGDADSFNEDTLTFTGTANGILAEFTVVDEDIDATYASATAGMDDASRGLLQRALRQAVQEHAPDADVKFDNGVEFTHTTKWERDEDGGVYTANVVGTLEHDPAYVATRDGMFFPAVYRALEEFGEV